MYKFNLPFSYLEPSREDTMTTSAALRNLWWKQKLKGQDFRNDSNWGFTSLNEVK